MVFRKTHPSLKELATDLLDRGYTREDGVWLDVFKDVTT
jgi:hypothetical protein